MGMCMDMALDMYMEEKLVYRALCRPPRRAKRQPGGSQAPSGDLQDEPRGNPEAAKSHLETAKTSQEAARRQPRGAPGQKCFKVGVPKPKKRLKASYAIPKWAPILGPKNIKNWFRRGSRAGSNFRPNLC